MKMKHRKHPERARAQKVSRYIYTHKHTQHTHTRTHITPCTFIPTRVREAQALTPMLRDEPIVKSVKYTSRLRRKKKVRRASSTPAA